MDGRQQHRRTVISVAAFLAAATTLMSADTVRASELAALAVEIGRTAVAMHHGAVNPRSIQPTEVTINHQGDICHFQAVMVWRMGTFGAQIGATPRRAVIYGSLINRADLRRLMDLEYVEAPDRPAICCDNAPKVITYWNTVFARHDTLSPMRELGQPLHRSLHPESECELCPSPAGDVIPHSAPETILPGGQGQARPFPKDEVYTGDDLARLLRKDTQFQRASAEEPVSAAHSRFSLPRIRTGRKPSADDLIHVAKWNCLSTSEFRL